MTKRLTAILLVCALVCLTGSASAKGRGRRKGNGAPPPAPVISRLEVNEEDERASRRVTLAVGQGTAIYTPSPVRQLISSIVSAPDGAGVCVSAVCQVENRQQTPGNIVYLTANRAGRSANLWIETADGAIMLSLTTVKAGAPFTHEVHIKTRANESQLAVTKLELQSCANQLGATRLRLDEAETAAKETAALARDAHKAGFGEGQKQAREQTRGEALAVFESLDLKGKARRHKTHAMVVTEAAPAFKTSSGWWSFYRVENRLDESLTISATSPAGNATLSGSNHTIKPRGKRRFAVFVETADATAPQVAVTTTSAARKEVADGK